MHTIFKTTTTSLWLFAWALCITCSYQHQAYAQSALTLTQPTYNCATGAITFNTTGGNGSAITYSAAGITRASASSNSGTIEAGLRADPKPIVITATQNGVSTTYTFNIAAACPGNFAVTQPTYNCATGAITFNTTGGDGSPITFTAPGITRAGAGSASGTVEPGLRADPKPIVITAMQNGAMTSYTFDLAAFCGNNPAPVNQAPVFSGTLTAISGIAGVPFSYTLPAGSFTDPDAGQTLTYTAVGLPTGLSINAGTGAITGTTSSTGANTITIRATDPGGLSASSTVGITFNTNLTPVFSGTLTSVTAIAGAPFSYTLPTGSFTDPNTGQTLAYTATGLPAGLSINAGTGALTGTASTTGSNAVVFTATDTGGLSASSTLGITVVPNVAPVFSGSLASVSATVGTPLNFTLPTGTFTDANTGQALAYSATGLPAGLSINSGSGAITGTPSATGTNSVTLTARDTGGLSTTGVVSINVAPNTAPVFSGSALSATGTIGSMLSYTLPTGTFTDANTGQTLTYTVSGLPAGLSINSGSGAITGMPSATGVSSVTITATDPAGASASGTVSLSVSPNQSPVFSGSLASATGLVGSMFSYTLPAGAFTDPNPGQTLTYAATGLPAGFSINSGSGAITGMPSTSGVTSVTITATDPAMAMASGVLSISISAAPTPVFSGSLASATGTVGQAFSYTLPTGTFTTAGGQSLSYAATGLPAGLTLNTTTGTISGTPTTAGSSTVTLRATNTGAQSASGTVAITISPMPSPTFTGTLVSATGTVGQAFSYTLPTGSFTDPSGQTLAYAATGLPAGLTINTATGAISGTPTAAGSNTVTLRATNAGGMSASTTVGITISTSATSGTGTAPVFSGTLASATGVVGQAFSYTLPAGTFTGGTTQTLTYAATGLPAGLSINTTTGAISGTPTTAGSNTVTLQATNTSGQSASGTVGITISTSATSGTGTAPVFSGTLASATGVVGQAFSYTLPAGAFTGGASQTLTYTTVNLPAGLTINTATGTISGTPTTAGSSTVTLRATNAAGQSASASVGITISASATSGTGTVGTSPVFTGTLVSATGVVGRAFSYTLPTGSFTDPNSQTLTYAATGLPAGLSINTTTGTISGTPTTAGSSTVTLRATNTGGMSASAVMSITISASATGSGRIAASESLPPIDVVAVGGNPIQNGIVEVAIRGAEGEPIQVQLTNMNGEVIQVQRRERAQTEERFRFDVSRQPGGTLLLRAVSNNRARAIRLLKVD